MNKTKNVWVLSGNLLLMLTMAVILVTVLILTGQRGFDDMPSSLIFNIGTELTSMFAGMVIIFCCMMEKFRGATNLNYIMSLVFMDYLMLATDELSWVIDGNPGVIIPAYIINTALYAIGPIMAFCFLCYVSEYLKLNGLKSMQILIKVLFVLTVITLVLIFGNLFGSYFFVITDGGVYQRTSMYPLSLFSAYVCEIVILVLVLIKRKSLRRIQFVTLLLYVIGPIICMLISLFFYGLSFTWAATMMVFLLVYCVMNVESSMKEAATKNELELANEIQVSLLPRAFPAFPDRGEFEVYASMSPAKEVGGDFYDFFLIDRDRLALVIGDVSGKGVSAALFMTIARTLIKNCAQRSGKPSTADILSEVGEKLSENNERGLFVTVWLGIVNLKTGHVRYCCAGHDYPAIKRVGEDYVMHKEKNSPAVALFPEFPFTEHEMTLSPGDRIFLYTDGLPEAVNALDEQYGFERILASLNSRSDEDDDALVKGVWDDVNAYMGDELQFDDLTMLSFTYIKA